jgi:F-type H+-transporting ATPase subunit epsilon
MKNLFFCEILTPKKKLFESKISSLIVPALEGYIGVMAGHLPMISLLGEGKIRLKEPSPDKNYKVYSLEIKEGVIQVKKNSVTLLVEV